MAFAYALPFYTIPIQGAEYSIHGLNLAWAEGALFWNSLIATLNRVL